ncbi:MAG: P-II family nitrogen regulator [Desulfobacterales bacterium]|nr:P-II family nitrogen regulator [Desulfobacterales bacterium]
MRFKLILSSVKPDITDTIVDAAKKAGAKGATILPGRGTGIHEAKTFFGLTLEAQTDIVLFVIEEHSVPKVLDAIKESGKFHEPGTGIAFVVPIEQVIGLESQLDAFRKEAREKYF